MPYALERSVARTLAACGLRAFPYLAFPPPRIEAEPDPVAESAAEAPVGPALALALSLPAAAPAGQAAAMPAAPADPGPAPAAPGLAKAPPPPGRPAPLLAATRPAVSPDGPAAWPAANRPEAGPPMAPPQAVPDYALLREVTAAMEAAGRQRRPGGRAGMR